MSTAYEATSLLSSEDKQWCHWGGVSALLLATGYVAIIPLFAWVGAPPASGKVWFEYLPGKTTAWWVILWLSVFTDICYLPVALALYFTLRRVGRNLMLAATFLLHLFVILDLTVTWTHHASLLGLFHSYTMASDDIHRAAYFAAAEYATAVLATPMLIVYAIVIPSAGVLLTGIVMLKGRFGWMSAYTGLITGLLGILSLTGIYPLVIGNAIGATLWFFLVGTRLLRLSRNLSTGYSPSCGSADVVQPNPN
jgi:hypothetical protein